MNVLVVTSSCLIGLKTLKRETMPGTGNNQLPGVSEAVDFGGDPTTTTLLRQCNS